MSFFFDELEVRSVKKGRTLPVESLHELECKACPMNTAAVQSPKMAPSGVETPDIYVLGEAPGAEEDKVGQQFVGRSGQILRQLLKPPLKLRWNNVIRDRPPSNRTPTPVEIECCRPSIQRDIANAKPRAIFGFGETPLKWATGQTGIGVWRGRRLPVEVGGHSCWYFPFFHPAYYLRLKGQEGREDPVVNVFHGDLTRALDWVARSYVPASLPNHSLTAVQLINSRDGQTGVNRVAEGLDYFVKAGKPVALDLETTGLRPYEADSRILTIAFSNGDSTLAIPMAHSRTSWSERQYKAVLQLVMDFLRSNVVKIAHNLAFELEWMEQMWGLVGLDAETLHDTKVLAYLLDERIRGFSLNFLTLENFGFELKKLSAGVYSQINQLDKAPEEEVLHYNGLDAFWTVKLYHHLRTRLKDSGVTDATYDLQRARIPALVGAQRAGVHVNFDLVRVFADRTSFKMESVKRQFCEEPAVKRRLRDFRLPKDKHPLGSEKFLHLLFYGDEDSSESLDEAALTATNRTEAKMVVEYRQFEKQLSTYLKPFLGPNAETVWDDGLIHTQFNSMVTSTGRLSSDSPNMQNFPKREHAWIREIIVPKKDHVFVACDYGQLEARVIAMASKDDSLVKSLWTGADIHREWAEILADHFGQMADMVKDGDPKSWSKLRHVAKNKLVFPCFYGASPSSISRNLQVPTPPVDRLLRTKFWDQFAGVKQWQERLEKHYNRYGWVECLTGRRRHAPLNWNRIINSPIQGTASDLTVDAMTRLARRANLDNLPYLQAILNIHDDLTFQVPKEELDEAIHQILASMLHFDFGFINVPITVEVSVGDDWYNMQEVGTFSSEDFS